MGILAKLRGTMAKALRTIRSRAGSVLRSRRKSPFPLSDRLLTDALRIAEIPSPTNHEEQRAAFILERLNALGLTPRVDEDDNIIVRLSCPRSDDSAPILLFADISSPRWHPLESLSRLDSTRAYGAGLADAIGTAALLSIAESMMTGLVACGRDILLLFAVRSLDDPGSMLFKRLSETAIDRPYAALGIRGISLGTISTRSLGTYRIEVRVRTDNAAGDGSERPGSSVDTIVSLARTLSGVTWDSENKTTCRIRRIEAGTGFGRNPTEGILDIEMESSDGSVLELAMKAAVATAEARGREAKAMTEVTIAGFVPVGDPKVGAGLVKLVTQSLKDHKIRMVEENGADPAAFLSSMGVPAISVAVASGREGLEQDEIDIASIEKGRKLLVTIVERIAAEGV
jgi:hypothetical protein